MATVTAFEAKTRFGEMLERVERGEEIVITRHSKPVARLVAEGKRDLRKVKRAVASLKALRKRMARRKQAPLTDEEIRSAIEEGRM